MNQGWKRKLFGDNNFNFYGWIFGGSIIIICSMTCVLVGLFIDSLNLIMVAIYLAILGIFGVTLQNYFSRLSEKIEEDKTYT